MSIFLIIFIILIVRICFFEPSKNAGKSKGLVISVPDSDQAEPPIKKTNNNT